MTDVCPHTLAAAEEEEVRDWDGHVQRSTDGITFMLTASAIAAIPIAVIITKGETGKEYAAGFSLLAKSLYHIFGGQAYPSIIIIDDSSAERNALGEVWPKSKRLLSQFHVNNIFLKLYSCINSF